MNQVLAEKFVPVDVDVAAIVNEFTRLKMREDDVVRRVLQPRRYHGEAWGDEELAYCVEDHLDRVARAARFAARTLTRDEYRAYLWQVETDRFRSAFHGFDVAARDAFGYALFRELAACLGA